MTNRNKNCLHNIDGKINGNRLGDRHLDGRTLIKRNLQKQAVKCEQDWTGLERGLRKCLSEESYLKLRIYTYKMKFNHYVYLMVSLNLTYNSIFLCNNDKIAYIE